MATPVAFDPNLPPEIDAQQRRIAEQQAVADAMLQRSMTPLPTNQGPLHWTQALAQVMNARQGRTDADAAAGARAGLGKQYQEGLAAEVARIAAIRNGKQIAPDPQEVEQSSDQGTPMPATASTGDPRAAVMAALNSQYPTVRKTGELDYAHMKKGDEPYTLKPGEARYDASGKLLNFELPKDAAEKAFKPGDIRKFLDGGSEVTQEYQKDGTWKELSRGSRREGGVTVHAAVTPVTIQDPNDPNKTIVVDGRSGRLIGIGPKLTQTGSAEFKRQFNMQGIGATIQEAEDLLTNKAKPPTGSGVGAAVDTVAGVFGVSPRGAAEAARLKAVGGALVSKMPRMEGPQSDKDVALYKEMAGMVGNASEPIANRVAALEEVKKLWAKYERLNPDAFAKPAAGSSGGGSVLRFDAQGNPVP